MATIGCHPLVNIRDCNVEIVYMDIKYKLDAEENKSFLRDIRNNLLDFGHLFPAPTGSSYWLLNDGSPWKNHVRETWITSRMVHVYSIGLILGHKEGDNLIEQGLNGLTNELADHLHGGWYSGVSMDGQPYGPKQCYAHAFVALAAVSAILVKKDTAKNLLEEVKEIYDRYFWQEDKGLTFDTWETDFSAASSYRGLNSNMHTVEAFLSIADVTGDELYRTRAGRIINTVIGWAQNNNWRIPEHYFSDWTPNFDFNRDYAKDPFKPYGATPGHGIEWARLIIQWAASVHGKPVNPYLYAAEHLFNRAVQDAWNKDGAPGLIYTTDWNGNPIVHDRMHWTLAEAINTSAVLFRVTGNHIYESYYSEFLQYLDKIVMDHNNGSWFHQLDRSNNVMDTIWPGKCDLYHALQSTLIPYLPVNLSISKAVCETF